LKAILEGTDMSIAEIRKEAFDFGRFLSAAENGRIGKYDAEKLSKYMFDKLKQKEQLIDKLQAKNVSYKASIVKKEQQIKHKMEMGEELKFIDFHQLQIENKKHVKDIDDRNNKLLILKVSSANSVGHLQELKDQLAEAEKAAQQIEKKLNDTAAQRIKQQSDIEKTEYKVSELKSNIKRQEAIIVKFKDDTTDPIEFVDKCDSLMKLKKYHRNWIRKIEIAELEGKKARALLKKHGQVWHDEPADEE
jgi:DNA repair exonuclease SbcCD ATPase subunit